MVRGIKTVGLTFCFNQKKLLHLLFIFFLVVDLHKRRMRGLSEVHGAYIKNKKGFRSLSVIVELHSDSIRGNDFN